MSRIVMDMDRGWRFRRGDIDANVKSSHSSDYAASKAGNAQGAAGRVWNDSDWRVVDLPHDYYAESDIVPECRHSHGYRVEDNAWYRKSFILPETLKDKDFMLVFEGTAVNAEFYLNGSVMARSFSAYTETAINVTDRLYFGGRPNILAVKINGKVMEGWWYEGAGIYRHVKLYVKDKLHVAHNGVFAKPMLKAGTKNSWDVFAEIEVENRNNTDSRGAVRSTLLDGERVVATATTKTQTFEYSSKTTVKHKLYVSKPQRWDVDSPKLYTFKTEILDECGNVIDENLERIGFRTFRIDAQKGFFLNDRPLKIMGTCNHQDHAGVGVAVPDSVQYYRVKRLKEMGTNAYRCSHNLPNKEILDACDEFGLIVMDENRRFESSDEVLHNLDVMVRRDRNHPSVIFWSLFNEEPLQNTDEGARIYRTMRDYVRHLDDSRIITGAINGNMQGAGLEMDATGINYGIWNIDGYHKEYPNQPIIGAENNSAVTTRGCYKSDREGGTNVLCNYDEERVPWGQLIRETWKYTMEREWFAGIFIWTGFDYRGEPTPFTWPSVSSQFGIMDTCGFPKDSFYYNKACFVKQPMIHLLPHWNWSRGDVVRVAAPTNCDEAELFLNGKSLGRKVADCINTPEWQVEFSKGRLLVKGYRNGKCVAKAEQRTAGKPYAIKIMPVHTSIKNDGADTAVVNFAIVDKKGIVVPYADDLIKFTVVGDGYVRGVGNGDPNSHESDILPQRRAYCGLCQALITSKLGTESIKLIAESDGLVSAEFDFEVQGVAAPVMPEDCNLTYLSSVTMSGVTEERPNALVELADNDQNSFIPVTFDAKVYQSDFKLGWRIYRCVMRAPMTGKMKLIMPSGMFRGIWVYVNGKLIVEDPDTLIWERSYETPAFDTFADEAMDIRILVYTRDYLGSRGAGFSDGIYLQKDV
ncbi:MAG: DUF4982 domain-containing protein [Ruminococcaceae bacterium]|nr:DUF4982 domain-containing protein [Oscillospiraceae bacterium]